MIKIWSEINEVCEDFKTFTLFMEKDGKVFNASQIIDLWIEDSEKTKDVLSIMIKCLISNCYEEKRNEKESSS